MSTCIVKESITAYVESFKKIYGCPHCGCAFEKCAARNKRDVRVSGSCNYVEVADCPKCGRTAIIKC